MTPPALFTTTLLLAAALPNSGLMLGQARSWALPGRGRHRRTPVQGWHAALLGSVR